MAASNEITHEQAGSGSTLSSLFTDPLPVIWRRKWLILFGLVLGLVLGSVYFAQRRPEYQSAAQVMVIKKANNPINSAALGTSYYYDDYLSTHQILLTSPRIIQLAIDKHHLAELPSFQGQADVAGAIKAGLKVGSEGHTQNILSISYKGPESADCATVLMAIIDSYKTFLDQTYQNVSSDNLTQVTQLTQTLKTSLEEKEKAYEEFRSQSPLVYWKGTDGNTLQDEWLSQIQAERLALMVQQAKLEARLTYLESAIKQGKSREELLAMVQISAKKQATAHQSGSLLRGLDERELEKQLLALRLKEKSLLADWGPDHPEVAALRQQERLLRDLSSPDGALTAKGDPLFADPVQRYVQELRQELNDVSGSIEALTKLVQKGEAEFRELSNFKAEDKRHKDAIARTQQMFEPIRSRLEEIKLTLKLGGYDAQVIAPANPGAMLGPFLNQILVSACFLGLLGGLALGFVAEVLDKGFRSPEEIRTQLGLPVIGHIPLLTPSADQPVEPGAAALDPHLCVYFEPKSPRAEAFRGVRTALYFSTGSENHKVIQVTSPEASDGKSTMVANLAISIAQSGKKTILIDADFRRPRLHKVFGLSNDIGVNAVLDGKATLEQAVRPGPVEDLFLLPCGPRPHNPAELLTSSAFQEFLDAIRQEYDYVLVDTPPLLVVSDPSVVAPRMDGVLLVIRVNKKARPNAIRAKGILTDVGANILGVIVNGAGKAGTGYGSDPYYRYAYDYQSYQDYHAEAGAGEEPEAVNGKPDHSRPRRRQSSSQGNLVDWFAKWLR